MPNSSREPSLLKDVGALAGMYANIFRLIEKRATGHSLIVRYEPPDGRAESTMREMPVPERKREHAHAGR